ncbi:cobalt/nickel transport system permease protein [Sedimentibacter acidaminivorans]|uniref:Cobalt/nickel transport system permease protein n=1 Tax=Sedimentibacter acidaminivorans TaxID=913099 RepID=A0ABS4GFW9_9FIRM|nr:cobalt ECF transporter T component CbiQ [Sedimentibacter acidaminivorans]MBP1926583.1 cobalt/nickel transport system permease protein [Sedimentibacter acidaminivorans]
MSNITSSIYKIRFLDEMSQRCTVIHKLHPLVKLIVSIVYIITTVSFDKYEIINLIPLAVYPIVIFNLGDIPFMPVFKRSLIVLPIVLGVGIFNPIIDKEPIIIFANVFISRGWISYLGLVIKCFFTVLCALLFISTTSIDNIAMSLSKLKVPKIFTIQFLLTYRYIYVLIEEFANIWTAYTLRAPKQKGIHYKSWGSLLGQLLMRTYDRAQSIYYCMVLRGYNGEYHQSEEEKLYLKDYIYLFIWICFMVLVRFYNIPVLLGSIMTGV